MPRLIAQNTEIPLGFLHIHHMMIILSYLIVQDGIELRVGMSYCLNIEITTFLVFSLASCLKKTFVVHL